MRRPILILIVATAMLSSCLSVEERNKKAEEKARAKTEKQINRAKGVGEALKGTGSSAMESITEGVSEMIKGANKGFDKSFVSVQIRLSYGAKPYFNVTRTRIDTDTLGNQEIISYLTFDKDCVGKLSMKLFDAADQEVARSVIKVQESADEAKYMTFPFDQRTSFSLVKYGIIEYKQ